MKRRSRDALGEIVGVRLPEPAALFEERAERLEGLAEGHAAEDWLQLLARLVRAQQRQATEPARVGDRPNATATSTATATAPSPNLLPAAARFLPAILAAARSGNLPAPAAAALGRLEAAGEAELHLALEDILAGRSRDLAATPFTGAALQLSATLVAAGLDATALAAPRSAPARCPVCGAPPVSSLVLGDDRLRYLACCLCGTEWHLPRVRCVRCGDTAQISYLGLEPSPEGPRGIEAEVCEACHGYVKVFDLAVAHGAEPLADEAAALVLDLLVGEHGYEAAGYNPLAPRGGAA